MNTENDEHQDEDLVQRAQDGEVRAFEALLDRHQGRVLRMLAALGVAASDRDDVAQEIFIRVFRHLPGFRKRKAFTGWLNRIAVNVVHSYRSSRAVARLREEPLEDKSDHLEDHRPGPQREAEGVDLARSLEAALDRLTERERAVFVLRELEGMDTAAIAAALGITRITVRRHLGRARTRIRLHLK